ncbi:flagellar biosynthetic protein FliO [Lutibaculum baratangense]|uniref:Flagellar biosynthesis protein FliO n=1 Tax=Lutibaculum baratangense AMV1 TaxID=631454 RepID=V4RUN1_9HYPH|nr:flagellar biosynthetic protein FliO [Lutibaculum baratangense]ESR26785.1 hypothetical protein N177_0569 [Lutibaculum baratangense AMV1]
MEFLEQLLDVELGLPARFFIAFVFVLLLIALTAWIIRRLAAGRSALMGLRTRQHRITVIDSAGVDAKRRLVLVRWDNTEHLLLVGGQTDIVVDSNGRRVAAADVADVRAPAMAGDDQMRSMPQRQPDMTPPRQTPPRPTAPAPRPQAPAAPEARAEPRVAPAAPAAPDRSRAAGSPTSSRSEAEDTQRQRPSPFAALKRVATVGRGSKESAAEASGGAEGSSGRPSPRYPGPQAPSQTPPRQPAQTVPFPGPAQAEESPRAPAAEPPAGSRQPEHLEAMATRLEAALRRPGGEGPAATPSAPDDAAAGSPASRRPETARPARAESGEGLAGAPGRAPRAAEQAAEEPRSERVEPSLTPVARRPAPPSPADAAAPREPAKQHGEASGPARAVEGRPVEERRESAREAPGNPFASQRAAQPAQPSPPRPAEEASATPRERPDTPARDEPAARAPAPRPAEPAAPRPAKPEEPAGGQPRQKPAEIDLAAAMAAELKLEPFAARRPAAAKPPEAESSEPAREGPAQAQRPAPQPAPRQAPESEAAQDTPKPQAPSDKENKPKDEDDEFNIYEQILKRDG